MDLDEVADELYEVPPGEFVARRKARQQEAKDAGDTLLAQDIGALPKPSTAAWVGNLLVRRFRDEIEGLVELGGLLREAQGNLAGDQLRTLNTQRAQLLNLLSRQAAALAREHGRPISSSVTGQVEETLRAAMADPEAGQALLSGRLSSPMSYSGLGTPSRPDLRLVHPAKPSTARRAPRKERPARVSPRRTADAQERRRQREEEQRRAAEEQRRRELAEARRQAEEATADAEEAEAAAQAARVRAEHLATRQAELEARIDQLTHELARTREECSGVGAELSRAQRRRQVAARRAAEAAAARHRATARVVELGGQGEG